MYTHPGWSGKFAQPFMWSLTYLKVAHDLGISDDLKEKLANEVHLIFNCSTPTDTSHKFELAIS